MLWPKQNTHNPPHASKRVTIWKYCIYLSPKSKSKDLIFLDKGGEEEQ